MSVQAIKDLVENPHPIYMRYAQYWDFLLESYEGGIDYTRAYIKNKSQVNNSADIQISVNGKAFETASISSNLFKHKKERSEDYTKRIEQSYYFNFCSPILDIYTNHLFKEPVLEDFKNIESLLDIRQNNIDRMGSNVAEYRKEMAEMAQIYGHIFVLTDMPKPQGEMTRADEIANEKFPYFVNYHPQDVLNWALDQFGQLYWVILREISDSGKDPSTTNKDKRISINYRLWTRTEWKLYDENYNQIEEGIHGLGVVPLTCVFAKKSKKAKNCLGISTIADISFIARDVYNAASELKQILRDQTFAFLAVQGKASDYNETTIGVNKGLVYPEGTNVPQYVSPPSQNAQVYFEYIDRQVRKMFQLAKLEGGSASQEQSATVESGVSKAWDFNQTNAALSQLASNLNDGEVKLWQNWSLWQGKLFEGEINYPDEFNIQSLQDDLTEAEQAFKLQLGKEFDEAVKESIIKKKFPRASDDDIDKMIESMKTPEQKPMRLSERFGIKKPQPFGVRPVGEPQGVEEN